MLEADQRLLDIEAEPVVISHTTEFHRLAPQSVAFERWTGYVFSLVVLAVALAIGLPLMIAFASVSRWVVPGSVIGCLCLAALLFWFAHVWPKRVFHSTHWRLSETGLEIHRGVWWKHRIAVPTARVQHVDVSQGPVQRLFQLATLTVHTAGTKNASIELAGLEHTQALRLRDQLIEQKVSLDVT